MPFQKENLQHNQHLQTSIWKEGGNFSYTKKVRDAVPCCIQQISVPFFFYPQYPATLPPDFRHRIPQFLSALFSVSVPKASPMLPLSGERLPFRRRDTLEDPWRCICCVGWRFAGCKGGESIPQNRWSIRTRCGSRNFSKRAG